MRATVHTLGERFKMPAPEVFDENVVEVSVLLPGEQASALEAAAHKRGFTVAQLVRHLIKQFTEEHKTW